MNIVVRFRGELIMLLVTLLWGATFVIVKESLNYSSTMLFISLRFLLALLILIPFKFKEFISVWKRDLLPGVILGVLLFGGFAAQTAGLKYTMATKSGFITGSAVVMIPILQTTMEKRLPTRGAAIGTVLVFTGILFLSSGGDSILSFISELGANFNIGDLLTLLCAVFYALYVVYLDIVSKKFDFWPLIFLQMIVTAVLGFAAAGLFAGLNIEQFRLEFSDYLIFGILYTAIFATLITTILQTRYQKLITPTKAGIIFSFEPIFAAIVAFFAINEKISNFGLIGSVLIFTGLVIAEGYDAVGKSDGKQNSSG